MTDDDELLLVGGKTDVQILTDVLALVEDRNRWCQEAYALDIEGNLVSAVSADAAAWSIEGALGVCSNEWGIPPPHLLEYLDQRVLDYMEVPGPPGVWQDYDVGWFNDYATHETMVQFMEGALECVNR